MSATHYDPDHAPNPREWLALDEHERIRLARNYHEAARIKLPDVKGHALFHAIVENQIAEGFGPSCRAIERLQQQGLSRHEAIHAIGNVVASFAFESVNRGPTPLEATTIQKRMNAAIDALGEESQSASGTGEENDG